MAAPLFDAVDIADPDTAPLPPVAVRSGVPVLLRPAENVGRAETRALKESED